MIRSLRFIGNLLFIIILLAILFSYAMFQGGFVSWFLFYSFSPILLYHLLLNLYPIKGWQITRNISKRIVQAGDSIYVTLSVRRKFPFPLYYGVFEEKLSETLNRKDLKHHNYTFINTPEKLIIKRRVKEIMVIGFRKNFQISYQLEGLPRGQHELRHVRVLVSDVFGFVKKEHTFSLEDVLIVQPNERAVKLLDTAVNFEHGQTAVHNFHLQNMNVATGVREYAPGDRFSWIHWKQTAKNQTVMTKEFEQERSNSILVVLDASQVNRKNPLAFEASVELSVSLLSTLRKNAADLELLVVGKEIKNFSLKESSFTYEEVRHYLTGIQSDGHQPFPLLMKDWMRQRRLERLIILTNNIDDSFAQLILELRLWTAQIVIFYLQGSAFISENEKEWIAKMKKEGTTIHVFTETELTTDPLEVNVR